VLLAERTMRLPMRDAPEDTAEGKAEGLELEDPSRPKANPLKGLGESMRSDYSGAFGETDNVDDEELSVGSAPSVATYEDPLCRVLALHPPNSLDTITLRVRRRLPGEATGSLLLTPRRALLLSQVLVDSSALQLGMGRPEDVDDYDEDFDEMMHGQVVVVAERTLSAVAAKDIVVTAQETRDVVKAFTTDPDRNIDAGALRSVVNKLYKGGGDTAQVGGLTPDLYQNALSAMDAKLSAIMSKLSIKEVHHTLNPRFLPSHHRGGGGKSCCS